MNVFSYLVIKSNNNKENYTYIRILTSDMPITFRFQGAFLSFKGAQKEQKAPLYSYYSFQDKG